MAVKSSGIYAIKNLTYTPLDPEIILQYFVDTDMIKDFHMIKNYF